MKISIIVPVHNAATTVKRCVESLGIHDPSELEILLIENNSTDNSWEICREIAGTNPTVTCLQTKCCGVSAARNLGLQMSTGQVIGFLDADDAVGIDLLTLVRDAFAQHTDCDVLSIGFQKVFQDGRRVSYYPRKRGKVSFTQMIPYVLCDHNVSGYVWNKYWRAEMLEGIRFREDLTHSEDTHFVIHALQAHPHKKGYMLSNVLYDYYQGENSLTALASNMFDEAGRLKLINTVYEILEEFPLREYHRLLAKRLVFSMASSQYLRFQKELLPDQRRALTEEMRKNVLWYVITFFVAPIETVKCFLRLMLFSLR